MNPSELAPFIRITLFIVGGWLQGKGADPALVDFIKTDPQLLSMVILSATSAWYAAAKYLNWKR